ncbi:MAG: MFS transporter [Christensenella sp.]|nr:MFS transporter [Christensenella sp.]
MQQATFRQTRYACYRGYIVQAVINNLAPILFIVFQQRFGITFSMIGTLVLINFGTQLIMDVLSVKFADRIGYRKCIVFAHLMCAAGLILLGTLPSVMPSAYAGLVISVVVYASGGGVIEVLVSPIVDSLPSDHKASSMSLLHSFYCWGQVLVIVVSTLVLQFAGHTVWFFLPIVWAILPIYNALRFLRVPLVTPLDGQHKKIPVKKLLASKLFFTAMVMMLCAGASELTMAQWSSLFAETALQVSKVMGDLLGPCMFALFMGIGRTVYGLYGKNINLYKALLGCAVLCACSYLLTSLAAVPGLSLLGCGACGFAVSLMWPGMYSYSSKCYPGGGTAMFGILAICGDLGCSLGPWLTGMISEAASNSPTVLASAAQFGLSAQQAGLKVGLFTGVIFPCVMIVGLILLHKLQKLQKKSTPAPPSLPSIK